MNLLNAGRAVVAFVAFCTLLPAVGHAQSEAEKRQQAKMHYETATRFYDVGKYGEAIAEYEQSYLLLGDAALLYNIGQAYRLWDRPDEAIRSYKNYLRQRPDAANRADVEHKIADLEKLAEERKRSGVAPTPETAPPALPQGGYPPVTPPPAGYPPSGNTAPPPVGPSGGPAPWAGSGQPPSDGLVNQPEPGASPPSDGAWLMYSLFGVSGAGLVVAAIAGAVGASNAKKLRDAADNREPFDPSLESGGKTANGIAVVAGVVFLAAGGTAGYLLWRRHKSAQPGVTLAPALAPSYAGGAALLTF